MKLSARLLVWYLHRRYPQARSAGLTGEPDLRCVCLWSRDTPPEPGAAVVVHDSAFTLPDGELAGQLFLWIGGPAAALEGGRPNVCLLPENIPAGEAAACLQRVFTRYEEWNQSLFESRLDGGSAQELLELTGAVIPNPMVLVGRDFSVLAAKGFPPEDPRSDAGTGAPGTGLGAAGLVEALRREAEYGEDGFQAGVLYSPGGDGVPPSLCLNIRGEGQAVCRLLVAGGEIPLDGTFGFVLERLSRLLAHALAAGGPVGGDGPPSLRKTFTWLLTDPSADYVEVSQRLSAAGWLSAHYYLCAVLRMDAPEDGSRALSTLCGYLEEHVPASCAVEHRGHAVLYVNLALCGVEEGALYQKLAVLIRDSQLRAGYSRKMLGHFNFQRQYVQALTALRMGGDAHPSRWIHHFNDIALPYLLEQAIRKLPAYMVCHERLLALKYQSENGQTQLYRTLRCYLDNNQSVARTAQELFIHRSTLLYRLERIRDVLRSDLSDPEERLYLLLSFRLIELESE